MLKRRQEDIKAKGFNLLSQGVTRYQEAEDEEILGYDTVDYSNLVSALDEMSKKNEQSLENARTLVDSNKQEIRKMFQDLLK